MNGLWKDFPQKVQKHMKEVCACVFSSLMLRKSLAQRHNVKCALAPLREAGTSRLGAWRPQQPSCGKRPPPFPFLEFHVWLA